MKAANSLSCARRGWVNVDVDKIECETCGANLKYMASTPWMSSEGESILHFYILYYFGFFFLPGSLCTGYEL